MKIISRFPVVWLLLFVVFGTIGAAEPTDLYHIIAYYSVEVKGSSDPAMLKAMISPAGGDPPFLTREAMEKALEGKRRKLNNMRLFEEVAYTYDAVHADETAIRYRVKFFVDDAFTFLAIPYPKYDSNYGFRVGIKGYDKNLFGKFTDLYFVVNATQIESSWEDWAWNAEVSITDIPIGKSKLNLDGTLEATQHGKSLEDLFYTASIDWRDIPLAQTILDFNVNLKSNDKTPAKDARLLTTSIQWEGLPWFNSTLLVKPSFQFKQENFTTPFDIDNATFYSEVNPIMINGETYVWTHNLKLQFPHDYLQSTASLTLVDASVFKMPVSFWISADNYFNMYKQEFYDNTYTLGSSLGFSLPFNITYKGTYEGSFRIASTTDLNLIPVLSTTQSISFGKVNWKRNFRQGLKGNLFGKADYALFTMDLRHFEHLNYVTQAELEGFLKIGQRIGLSGRAMGFYSHVPSFTWYENQEFPSFMPNKKQSAPELLRGILNATYAEVVGSSGHHKLGMVVNLDATLMFVKFKGFAEGFISAFMDLGLFTPAYTTSGSNSVTDDDLILLKTVGIEGYGILDKFPSYPIRASLGFNVDDVAQHLAGEVGFNDIEFELFIGMGLHY